MVARNRSSCLRSKYAVDFSTIITFLGEPFLSGGDGRIGILIDVAVLPVIFFGLVTVRIVIPWIVVVQIGIVTVAIVVAVWIQERVPGIKSEVEDDPGTVNEMATVTVPEMITPAIPVTLPVGRALCEYVVMPIRA